MIKSTIEAIDEVKNCPFCGEKAEIFTSEDIYSWKPTLNFGVGCKTEDCYGEQCFDLAYFSTKEDALKSWNKRAK